MHPQHGNSRWSLRPPPAPQATAGVPLHPDSTLATPTPSAGVGKGTYSGRVSDYFGLAHIASGDLVRDEMRRGTVVGKQVRRLAHAAVR